MTGSWELAKMSISMEKKETPSRAWTAETKAWHGKGSMLATFHWQQIKVCIGKGKHNCFVKQGESISRNRNLELG